MPLKIQQDGSVVGGQPNTVLAAWWNDYHDLLTGVMTDQDVTLATDLVLKPMSAVPTAPTAAAQAGTGLGIGVYQYAVLFGKAGQAGFSGLGAAVSVTTTSGNQAVGLSNIPLGPAGTNDRLLYRTTVGGSTFGYLGHLGNNTATTFVDTTPDGSLGGAPSESNFGGCLVIVTSSGTVKTQLFSDGGATFSGTVTVGALSSTGGIAAGSTIFQQGSPVALTGSHGAGQVALSYGSGVPATLGSNEIYFQIS